jgi:hypothetical protein
LIRAAFFGSLDCPKAQHDEKVSAKRTLSSDARRTCGKHPLEMMLQQVFEQACGDCASQVLPGVLSPAESELQNSVGLRLDELSDADDRLPARIPLALGGRRTGKDAFRAGDGSSDGGFGRHR